MLMMLMSVLQQRAGEMLLPVGFVAGTQFLKAQKIKYECYYGVTFKGLILHLFSFFSNVSSSTPVEQPRTSSS